MTVAAAAVGLREVERTRSAEAVVEAVRQSTVASQIAGRIVDLPFDVGDRVKKGDVIARIDERAATQALEWKKFPHTLPDSVYFELPNRVRTLLAELIGGRPEEVAVTAGA